MFSTASVRLFVREQDYARKFQAILLKDGRLMDYCRGKTPLNFGIDPTQNGQLAAILYVYHILHIDHTQYEVAV